MKAILITFFYHPEAGAPQSRLASQTKVMLDRGHYVDVLTTMPNYPIGKPFSGYAGRIFMAEKNGDNFIYRVWSLGITNLRPFWRILKYLTFLMASIFALFALRAKGKRYDCILVESPPLFTCIVGVAAKALWRAPLVTQVSDLWVDLLPEFEIRTNASIGISPYNYCHTRLSRRSVRESARQGARKSGYEWGGPVHIQSRCHKSVCYP
jgi:hypothetical protein